MEAIFVQLLTSILLSVWQAVSSLPHHMDDQTMRIIARVLTRLLKQLGNI
jgi:hypothetical protein